MELSVETRCYLRDDFKPESNESIFYSDLHNKISV